MSQESLQDKLRRIPGVYQLLLNPAVRTWVLKTSRTFVVGEIQRLLDDVRAAIRAGDEPLGRAGDGE